MILRISLAEYFGTVSGEFISMSVLFVLLFVLLGFGGVLKIAHSSSCGSRASSNSWEEEGEVK